jgi:DNA-binding CsgD family transcriptional regulator
MYESGDETMYVKTVVCPHCGKEITIQHGSLTERELEIVKLAAIGFNNKEISDILWITISTVKNHLSNVYEKLNITNRIELVGYLIVNKLVDSDEIGVSRKVDPIKRAELLRIARRNDGVKSKV